MALRAGTLLALCLAWRLAGAETGAPAGAGAGAGAAAAEPGVEPGHVLPPRGRACPSPPAAPVARVVTQLLVDYARWRAWKEAVLFVSRPRWCEARAAAVALSAEGVAVGLQPVAGALLPAAFHVPRHRLGAVLLPGARDDHVAALLAEVSEKLLFNTYLSWLVVEDLPPPPQAPRGSGGRGGRRGEAARPTPSAIPTPAPTPTPAPPGCSPELDFEGRFRFLNVGLDSDLVLAAVRGPLTRRVVDPCRPPAALGKLFPGGAHNASAHAPAPSATARPRPKRAAAAAAAATGRRSDDRPDTSSPRETPGRPGGGGGSWNSSFANNRTSTRRRAGPAGGGGRGGGGDGGGGRWGVRGLAPNRSRSLRRRWHRQDVGLSFALSQLYKVRMSDNSSLVAVRLGAWEPLRGAASLAPLVALENRTDMQGLPLIVGIKNATGSDAQANALPGVRDALATSDDDFGDDTDLLDVLDYLTRSLNASYELVSFTKLGWRNEEKAWLYLLGAVASGAVDLGLDNVVMNRERAEAMFFSFPIVESMKNIYFRRPDSGGMRDIFLAPFSPRLLLCVAATGLVLALAAALVHRASAPAPAPAPGSGSSPAPAPPPPRRPRDLLAAAAALGMPAKRPAQPSPPPDAPDTAPAAAAPRWTVGEAVVWSISVLCMQGSPWSPSTASGSLVLIFSLCFALIIYNAYAAFITSVLSVRVASIRGLADLLRSDFKFGYTLAGQDEVFLRTVNDTELRKLYFRGLVRNHGVEDAASGLRLLAEGGYAFFVSSRLARRGLAAFVAHDRRCGVQELPVESTRSVIALPMPLLSPYRRLINVSLMRMRETGVLARMRELMLPSMPRCEGFSTFNSARLSDVYSAFVLLVAGLALAATAALAEALWRHREALGAALARRLGLRRLRLRLQRPQRQPHDAGAPAPRHAHAATRHAARRWVKRPAVQWLN